ncbi:MAG: hypothetical protein ACOC31_05945 [Bacteroidota bacterium]
MNIRFAVRKIHLVIPVFTILVIAGCNTANRDAQTTDTQEQATELNKQEIEANVEALVADLPTPFEFAQMLNEIGIRYVSEVLNTVNNVDNYFTEKSQALNLGVYSADLGYSTIYENQEDIRAYMEAVKTLLDELKVDVDYSFLMDENHKERMADKDTIVDVVTETFFEAYEFLNEKNSPELAALMAAGMWIEGVYIATHISDESFDNVDMVKLIYEQGNTLTPLIDLLNKFEGSNEVKDLATDLQELKAIYDRTEGSLTKEELQMIKNNIEKLRAKIIS